MCFLLQNAFFSLLDTRSERGVSVARSERRNPSAQRDTDEDNAVTTLNSQIFK